MPSHQDFETLSSFKGEPEITRKLLVSLKKKKEQEILRQLTTSRYEPNFGNAIRESLSSMTSWQGAHRDWIQIDTSENSGSKEKCSDICVRRTPFSRIELLHFMSTGTLQFQGFGAQ